MDEISVRLFALLDVVLPLLLFMAWVYLALHMVFARFITGPDSPVLWFFSVVTGPLTRPIRAVLAPGTPEGRVRAVSLGVYVGLWLLTRVAFVWLRGAPR